MGPHLLSLLIAFLGYSLLNISQACQKLGLGLLPRRRLPGVLVWSTGTAGTSAAVFVLLAAVSLGNVSLVGAMAGSGLASLALFSRFVLREQFGRRELAGIGVILAAAALVGAVAAGGEPGRNEPALPVLYLLLAGLCAAYVILWIAATRKTAMVGLVIAAFAGALGGFVPLFQKVSTSESARQLSVLSQGGPVGGAAETLSNPYAAAWIVISILSMLVLQFAHRREQAIRTIPAFAANTIMVPLLGGLAVFGERLHPLQWLGLGGILAGVMLLTLPPRRNRRLPA